MNDQEKSFQFINDTILSLVDAMVDAGNKPDYDQQYYCFEDIKILVRARKLLEDTQC